MNQTNPYAKVEARPGLGDMCFLGIVQGDVLSKYPTTVRLPRLHGMVYGKRGQ